MFQWKYIQESASLSKTGENCRDKTSRWMYVRACIWLVGRIMELHLKKLNFRGFVICRNVYKKASQYHNTPFIYSSFESWFFFLMFFGFSLVQAILFLYILKTEKQGMCCWFSVNIQSLSLLWFASSAVCSMSRSPECLQVPHLLRLMDVSQRERETGGRWLARTSVSMLGIQEYLLLSNPWKKTDISLEWGSFLGSLAGKSKCQVVRDLEEMKFEKEPKVARGPDVSSSMAVSCGQATRVLQVNAKRLNRIHSNLTEFGLLNSDSRQTLASDKVDCRLWNFTPLWTS